MSLTDPIFHLRAVGALLVVLAAVHVVFPRYFRWSTDLAPLSLINRQLMQVHTFFVALAVGLMGLLSWFEAPGLVETPLGRRVSAGLAVFWGARWYAQHFVYSSALWRGKAFETAVHVLFTLLWTWVTFVYLWVALGASAAR
jgi:hypothetical protein